MPNQTQANVATGIFFLLASTAIAAALGAVPALFTAAAGLTLICLAVWRQATADAAARAQAQTTFDNEGLAELQERVNKLASRVANTEARLSGQRSR